MIHKKDCEETDLKQKNKKVHMVVQLFVNCMDCV
jgi:hypothetical protein